DLVERRAFLLRVSRRRDGGPERRHEQVHVDAEQPLGRLAAHHVADDRTQVAALGDVARVAESVHQLGPGAPDAAGVPADLTRLARAPVVLRGPVAREFLQGRQLDALRAIWNELPARPARRSDASAQVVQLLLRNVELEGPDFGAALDAGTHNDLLVIAVSGT